MTKNLLNTKRLSNEIQTRSKSNTKEKEKENHNQNNDKDVFKRLNYENQLNSNIEILLNPVKSLNSDSKVPDIHRRNQLLSQIEFYFSDENLIRDEFMRKTMINDKEKSVKISIIREFPRIKSILHQLHKETSQNQFEIQVENQENKENDENDENEKSNTHHLYDNYIKSTVESLSSKLKLSSNQRKIKKIQEFDFKKCHLIKEEIDKRTLYIKNLPSFVDNDMLQSIFSKVSRIKLIYIPKNQKYVQIKTENINSKVAFVVLESIEECEKSILSLQNLVPLEFLRKKKRYNEELFPLELKYKKEFDDLKEETSRIKGRITRESSQVYDKYSMSYVSDSKIKSDDSTGVCIEMINNHEDLKFHDLKIKLSHLIQPKYIDMMNNSYTIQDLSVNNTKIHSQSQVINKSNDYSFNKGSRILLRFENSQKANDFYEMTKKNKLFYGKYDFQFLDRSKEEVYLRYVSKLQEEYRLKKELKNK